MSSLTPILSIPFLLSLGISLILIGFVGVFFYQKITEQNHKISSMVDLISTMAEELNYIRSRVQSGGAVNTLPSGGTNAPTQIPLFNSPPVKSADLINVSDDEDNDSEDEEEEEHDESDEESDDDDDDESSDTDSDEEVEEETVRVINISDSLLHSVEENVDVEEIPSENNDNDDMDDSSEDEDLEDDKSSVSSENESKIEIVKLNEVMEEPQEFEPVLDIDATLLKSIHMTFPTSENIDYKKLSLNKLRQIVSEKNLSSDSSKLKKPELLKLLGVE
jgi:hypothetical protein